MNAILNALRWGGYMLVALTGLAIVIGVGMYFAAFLVIGGAIVCLILLVIFLAGGVKAWLGHSPKP